MPIKPPIRPTTEGERTDPAPTPALGTSPVPKEIKTPTPGRGKPRDTELEREKKVFDKRAEESARHA